MQEHGTSRGDCQEHATAPSEATARPTISKVGRITSHVLDLRDRQRRSLRELREATVNIVAEGLHAVRRCSCKSLPACAQQALHLIAWPSGAGDRPQCVPQGALRIFQGLHHTTVYTLCTCTRCAASQLAHENR